jgi:hypothetical protein
MKAMARGDAFDGQHVRAVMADRKGQTGIDPPPVDDDGAGTALAAVAALLGSSEIKPFAQKIEQRDARIIKLDRARDTVDGECR